MDATQNAFREWCKVELFGHTVIVGLVSEKIIAGEGFIQVDVPKTDTEPAFTKLYGKGAIYCMSPVSEEIARMLLARYVTAPVQPYELPQLTDKSTNDRAYHPTLEETDSGDDNESEIF
jgi:hypothetical protein